MTEEAKRKERERYKVRRVQILAQKKLHYAAHKSEKREYNQRYWMENMEAIKIKKRKYHQKNREAVNARNYKYAKANRDKVNVWIARWRANNPGKVTAAHERRRAREIGAKTDKSLVDQFYQWVKNQDYVSCTYCGTFISGKSVNVDHIVPLSRGGDHLPDNFCVSCKPCNSSKGDLMLSEWPSCPSKFKGN